MEQEGDNKLNAWKRNWLRMSVKKQFETAVSIIRGLPKDGPYQPSNQMMLKFYGYYKQATEGPCSEPKPSFWDVIRRAKWDAWHKLGDMSSEEAMKCYVDSLKQIIETMSYSAEVADFMETLGPFYESIDEEESNHGDSGIELEPGNVNALLGNFDDAMVQGSDMQAKAQKLESRVEKMMQEMDNVQKMLDNNSNHYNSDDEEDLYEDPSGDFDIESSVTLPQQVTPVQVDQALKDAVQKLNCDIDHLKTRVTNLEALARPKHQPSSTVLGELSGPTTAFVIAWPFVAFALMKICSKG